MQSGEPTTVQKEVRHVDPQHKETAPLRVYAKRRQSNRLNHAREILEGTAREYERCAASKYWAKKRPDMVRYNLRVARELREALGIVEESISRTSNTQRSTPNVEGGKKQ
jgi:hypothetical protein